METLAIALAGVSARVCALPLSAQVQAEYASWLPAKWNNAVEKRKAQAIGARWCAAVAARALKIELTAVTLDEAGCPQWPVGLVGSLSHSDSKAVAVVSTTLRNLGVDVEELFDHRKVELLSDTVLTPDEKKRLSADAEQARWQLTTIFSLKEAAYKALFPELRVFIDFHQLEVDLAQFLITHESGLQLHGHVTQHDAHVISVVYR
jgi:4'-phosphopantetheinyl transferase EntD